MVTRRLTNRRLIGRRTDLVRLRYGLARRRYDLVR